MLLGTVKAYLALRQASAYPADKRQSVQQHALAQIYQYARSNVPMYQRLYAAVPAEFTPTGGNLSALPIVTKQHLKQNFPDRLIAPETNVENLYEVSSSGTADRVMLFQDDSKRDWDRAADLFKRVSEHFASVLHVPPDDCYERCGLGDEAPAVVSVADLAAADKGLRRQAWRDALGALTRRFVWKETAVPAPGVDGTAAGDEVIDDYFNVANRTGAEILKALPMYLFMFGQRANGRVINGLRYCRPVGGKATPFMIGEIERLLRCRYWEHYGSAELGTVAEGCVHNLLYPVDHLFHLEFVRQGKPVPRGEIGELVITDLRNFACPLIRYATGDIGRFVDPCCDLSNNAFEVFGRIQETVVSADGDVIRPDMLLDLFLAHADVDYAKIIQRSDNRFVLQCVGAHEDNAKLESTLNQLLDNFLGYPVQLRVQQVRRIAPEGSGKYRLVESCSFDRFHGEVDAA